MHPVRSILEQKGQEVVRVECDATVLEAAERMNKHHIGALVVTEAEKVVGIFTERDILNRVVARERNPSECTVREVMTSPVACCSPETTRAECRAVMRNRRIRHLPVVDEGKLVGIVSVGDLLQDEGNEQQETIQYLYEMLIGGVR